VVKNGALDDVELGAEPIRERQQRSGQFVDLDARTAHRRRRGELLQRHDVDFVLLGQERDPLDDVPNLTDVAGPGPPHQPLDRRLGEPQLARELGRERIRQLGNVLRALRERRDVDRDDVEPVEEVLPESPFGDSPLEIDVRRHQDAGQHGELGFGPQWTKAPVLEHAQQFGLEVDRHVGDLVEQQRSGARLLHLPSRSTLGPREGAALVAKDERLDQGSRQRRAVDGDERLVPSRARLVERPRHELLAGARLAADAHRRLRVGHSEDQPAYVLDGR
jgi:hypothetical protein